MLISCLRMSVFVVSGAFLEPTVSPQPLRPEGPKSCEAQEEVAG